MAEPCARRKPRLTIPTGRLSDRLSTTVTELSCSFGTAIRTGGWWQIWIHGLRGVDGFLRSPDLQYRLLKPGVRIAKCVRHAHSTLNERWPVAGTTPSVLAR